MFYCTRCGTKTGNGACCEGYSSVPQHDVIRSDHEGTFLCCPVAQCAWRRPLTSQSNDDLNSARVHFETHQEWHLERPERMPAKHRSRTVAPAGSVANHVPLEVLTGLLLLCPVEAEAQWLELLTDTAIAQLLEQLEPLLDGPLSPSLRMQGKIVSVVERLRGSQQQAAQ